MPNIDKIEEKERSALPDHTLSVLNYWYAKVEIPSLIKSFINPNLFSWKDKAIWNEQTLSVSYSLESFVANDLFSAIGTNTFRPLDENSCELEISFSLEIYANKVPGVPRLLASKVTPTIEGLVEKMLSPNLGQFAAVLQAYFKN